MRRFIARVAVGLWLTATHHFAARSGPRLPLTVFPSPSGMPFTPSPISPVELLKRQLTDWQQFYADLTLTNAPASDLTYAQQQIDRLTEEISQYAPGPKQ